MGWAAASYLMAALSSGDPPTAFVGGLRRDGSSTVRRRKTSELPTGNESLAHAIRESGVNLETLEREASMLVPGAPVVLHGTEAAETQLLEVQVVELQMETPTWRVAKLYVPVALQVARWWTTANDNAFSARLVPSLTGLPKIHVQMLTPSPFELNGA